jgi:predicted peroxiredoxin
MANRRNFVKRLGQLCGSALAMLGTSAAVQAQPPAKKLKIMMKSAWGSDDPTRGAFVFSHGLVLAEAGHEVQIFLTGEATYLMRKATVEAIKPVGWPPLSETMEKIVAKRVPVFA